MRGDGAGAHAYGESAAPGAGGDARLESAGARRQGRGLAPLYQVGNQI